MDENTFEVMITNIEKFAKEVFSSGTEGKFQVRLMKTLDRIMKLGKSQNIKWLPNVESEKFVPCKKIKLGLDRKIDLPNEIWCKIFKHLPSKDVYQSLNLVISKSSF